MTSAIRSQPNRLPTAAPAFERPALLAMRRALRLAATALMVSSILSATLGMALSVIAMQAATALLLLLGSLRLSPAAASAPPPPQPPIRPQPSPPPSPPPSPSVTAPSLLFSASQSQRDLTQMLESEVLPLYAQPFPERTQVAARPSRHTRFTHYADYQAACSRHEIDPRGQHGARHAARVAILSQVFWRLEEAFDAEGLPSSSHSEPSSNMVVGAAFHDAGRQAEGPDLWDADSADLFAQWLQRRGLPTQQVQQGRHWLAHKDPRDRQYTGREHRCIHDADCLEIIRFNGPRRNFRWENLALWNLPGASVQQLQALRQTIGALKEEWADFIDYVEDRQPNAAGLNQPIYQNPASAYRLYTQTLAQRDAASRWPTLIALLQADSRQQQRLLLAGQA